MKSNNVKPLLNNIRKVYLCLNFRIYKSIIKNLVFHSYFDDIIFQQIGRKIE